MPRRHRQQVEDAELRAVLDRLTDVSPGGPSMQEQCALVEHARGRGPEVGKIVDHWLLYEIDELRLGLADAQAHQAELRRLHARLTSPPWFPAVFLRVVEEMDDKVIVIYQGAPRIATVADDVDVAALATGDDVLLTQDLNVVLRSLTPSVTRACEVAEFQHVLDDGRLVLKGREAETIARAAGTLDTAGLRAGDRVRWDPLLALAFERLPRSSDSSFFLAEMPRERFADIGGLDAQIERLQWSIRLHMRHPELVQRYRLRPVTSVLLVGPPGTGKTLVARALAQWLGEEAPGGRSRFMHIKPGALHSMWYSQSEANYREIFRVAKETAAREPGVPVVLFFDEVDAVGLTRSEGLGRVDDRVITSFMAELDGLEARGNVLVVAATNRREALDPALLRPGRLGDLVLEVPRPSMAAARAILERHLPEVAPYAGPVAGEGRRDAIDAVVSRLYAPNGEGEVGALVFRDGTRRPILARDLVSGAVLANIARLATERACLREIKGGVPGIAHDDAVEATAQEVERAVGALTPFNCHAHLSGLPQDLAVVRVETAAPRGRAARRLLSAA
jgi:proteasome-associated ATPase